MRLILVTGAGGLLGPHMVRAARRLGTVVETSRTAAGLPRDLTNRDEALDLLRTVRPDVVINCAGNPFPDACEQDPERAWALNRDIPRHLAEGLGPEATLVHISSDQLYPDTPGPHREDGAAPINEYGRSKLAGEFEALKHGRSLVLRANFFGPSLTPHRASFSDFVRQALGRGEPIKAFSDLSFSPLHFDTLGGLLVSLVERGVTGVYNAGSRGGMTKADFILAAAQAMGLDASLVEVTDSSGFGFTAKRPKDMRLDVSRIEDALGAALPETRDEIQRLRA